MACRLPPAPNPMAINSDSSSSSSSLSSALSSADLNEFFTRKIDHAYLPPTQVAGEHPDMPTIGQALYGLDAHHPSSQAPTLQDCCAEGSTFPLSDAIIAHHSAEGGSEANGPYSGSDRTCSIMPIERLGIQLDLLLLAAADPAIKAGPYSGLPPVVVRELAGKFPARIRVSGDTISVSMPDFEEVDTFLTHAKGADLLGANLLPGGAQAMTTYGGQAFPALPCPSIAAEPGLRNDASSYGAVLRSVHKEEAERSHPVEANWCPLALRGRNLLIEEVVNSRSEERHLTRVAAARTAYLAVAKAHATLCWEFPSSIGLDLMVRVLAMIDIQGQGGEGDLGGDAGKFASPHLPWITRGSGAWAAWRRALIVVAQEGSGEFNWGGGDPHIYVTATPSGAVTIEGDWKEDDPHIPCAMTVVTESVTIGAPIKGMGRLMAARRLGRLAPSGAGSLLMGEGSGGLAAMSEVTDEWLHSSAKRTTTDGWESLVRAFTLGPNFHDRVAQGEWRESVRWEDLAFLLRQGYEELQRWAD